MKNRLSFHLMIRLSAILFLAPCFSACDILGGGSSDGTDPIGGDPSPMGAVGHEYSIVTPNGVSNENIKVTSYEDEVSTVQFSGKVENPFFSEILKSMNDCQVDGNQVFCERKYRITTEGFQNVFENGHLTFMNYKADVGDTYSMKQNGRELKRVVTKVSKKDEYEYAFWRIKTVHVEETGLAMPGVSKIEYVGNHRFGLVGVKLYFEDGSSKNIPIFAQAENE